MRKRTTEPLAMAFLNSKTVVNGAEVTLGLWQNKTRRYRGAPDTSQNSI